MLNLTTYPVVLYLLRFRFRFLLEQVDHGPVSANTFDLQVQATFVMLINGFRT